MLFRDAIDETLERISLATGVDVQTYAEEPIKDIIVHKFHILFDAAWWPQFYNPGETFTLDGATGTVTNDLTAKIKRWMDIRHVWLPNYTNPLPRLHSRSNPNHVRKHSISPINTNKIFKVWPITTTGDVVVSYRTKPADPVADGDNIDMDQDLLVLGSAYDYLNSMGTNPEEEAKLLSFFDNRYKTLVDAIELNLEVGIDNYEATTAMEWQEVS